MHKGAWLGPGVVLGTESKEHEGTIIPCSAIWVVINDRLWRCAPQQLRKASEREHSEHVLQQARPWTFESISKNLTLGQYRNVAEEQHPDDDAMDEEDPQNAGQHVPSDTDMMFESDDKEDGPPKEPPTFGVKLTPEQVRLRRKRQMIKDGPRKRLH